MISVLFICDTNITLSPLAAAILRRASLDAGIADKLKIQSAGAHPGLSSRPVDRRIIKLCKEKEIPLAETTSREVTSDDVNNFDLLIVMNENNFWHIKSISPQVSSTKLKLFMEYSKQLAIREVPDPLMGDASFEEVYKILLSVCDALLERISKQFSLSPDPAN